jgi:hypothetical protein
MAAPTPYTRGYSFDGFEAVSPADPKPGAELDSEFDDIAAAVASTQAALADVRRSDGALQNSIVTRDSMAGTLTHGKPVLVDGNRFTTGAISTVDASALTAVELRDMVDATRGVAFYETYAAAVAANVPSAVNLLRVLGYAEAGDQGHADYIRLTGYTGGAAAGHIQTDDGSWWRLASRPISPRMFGDDDDAAFAAVGQFIAAEAAAGRWRYGFLVGPDEVDLRGQTYTLTAPAAWLAATLANGVVNVAHNTGHGLTLGVDSAPQSEVWAQATRRGFSMNYTGVADSDYALLYIPKTAATYIDPTCSFNAGVDVTGPYIVPRARYGVYMGRYYAFLCTLLGGFRGGQCALRVGRENDQTSNTLMPTVLDRAKVANAILCNWKGGKVKLDGEHSQGPINVAFTSKTNGSTTAAEGVSIEDGYQYNANVGGAAAFSGSVGVLIGKDVAGTLGWDDPSDVITSDRAPGGARSNYTARNFKIRTTYTVSDHVEFAYDVAGLDGFDFELITWGGSGASGAQYFARFAGPCEETRIRCTANQNLGDTVPAIDISGLTTDAIPMLSKGNIVFSNLLVGATTPGVLDYTGGRQDGRAAVVDNMAHVTISAVWTAITTPPAGAITATGVPALLTPAADGHTGVMPYQRGFQAATAGLLVQAEVVDGSPDVRLTVAGTNTPVDAADLAAAGGLKFTISFPINPW